MNIRHRFLTFLREYRSTLLFIGFMLVFRASYADWMLVPSGSMNPTILEGDRVLVDKHVYGWRVPFTTVRLTAGAEPQRGDIAVFYSPKDGTRLIKRVVGLPGDEIEMKDEKLYVNGVILQYATLAERAELLQVTESEAPVFFSELLGDKSHAIMFLPLRRAMRDFDRVQVPPDRYLMLGDNRDNSEDSRYIGLVPRENIVGKATRVLASLNPEHYYFPRNDRYWRPLL